MTIAIDDDSRVVEPIKEINLREMLKPARTMALVPADHWQELDGAFDAAFSGSIQPAFEFSIKNSFTTFIGYGALQQLAQDALIRLCIQTRTDEMLRSWIEIKTDDQERKDALERVIREKKIQDKLSQALTLMGLMGGSYLYIDTGTDSPVDILNKTDKSAEVKPSRELDFAPIDPIFTTPQTFNAVDPLKQDFYKPSVFYIQSIPVHRSRLIRFVENEVPDLLKPSYNFLGIPQAQLLSDYVTHFRENREQVNRLLKKFSMSVIKAKMKDQLYNGKSLKVLSDRVRLLAKYRNNDGIALLDFDTEDFVQVNTPLAGLTDIVRQSLEFVVSMNQSGVVKTLGYTPNGFSSGESDVKLQADLIATRQEKILRGPITEILKLLQLHIFGNIDPNLTFDFNPLDEDDQRTTAEVEKLKADTAAIYLDRGVVNEDEVRDALREDDTKPYGTLEGDAPGAPDDPFGQMNDPLMDLTNGKQAGSNF